MMNPSDRTARVYAEALIAIAREREVMPEIYEDLMGLLSLYDGDPQFRAFFTSPRIDPAEKFRVLRKALDEKISKPVLGLLKVMIDKGRELLLDNVADQFARYKDEAEGNVHVHVRTARALGDDQKDEIRRVVEAKTKQTAVLHEKVEPDLIGGTIVRVGDFVVDGSLKRKLRALRKNLVAKQQIFE